MKTINLKPKSPKHTLSSLRITAAITGITDEVTLSRQAFLDDLKCLPSNMRKVVLTNYNHRLARGRGKPMLGEYAPWLLAELLPIRRPAVIKDVLPPWMNFYAYSLFVDDILDFDNKVDAAPLLIASGLLLERGIAGLCDGLPLGAKVRIQLDKYFLECAQAVFRELEQHRHKFQRYRKSEVEGLGEKVSLLKLCASCLLIADGANNVDEELLLPVGILATGMQMLDDITDWQEDWRSGNYSYLLTQTVTKLRNTGIVVSHDPSGLPECEVFVGMIITGALESYLSTGIGYLQKILHSPKLGNQARSRMILSAIVEENLGLLEQTQAARRMWIEFEATHQAPGDLFAAFLRKKHTKQTYDKIQKRIQVIAQST